MPSPCKDGHRYGRWRTEPGRPDGVLRDTHTCTRCGHQQHRGRQTGTRPTAFAPTPGLVCSCRPAFSDAYHEAKDKPDTIEFCPLHQAAKQMEAILSNLFRDHERAAHSEGICECPSWETTRAVLVKAVGVV